MLRSAAITQGIQRSPNRAMLRAVGFGDGDFNKPIIGIAQTGSDLSPCNRIHVELAKRVRDGIRDAGGIPAIKALREGLAANDISRVLGILNGTCNFVLTEMEKSGRAYADVLREAGISDDGTLRWRGETLTSETLRAEVDAELLRRGCAADGTITAGGPQAADPHEPAAVKVIKGGSYLCSPDYCVRYRPGARQPQDEDLGTSHVGFRTVLLADGPPGVR